MGTQPNYRQLRLDPLPRESLAELLQVLLGLQPESANAQKLSDAGRQRQSVLCRRDRTGAGRYRRDRGRRSNYRLAKPFSSQEIPPTVQAVLAARIDALPAAEKRLLQEASVIGHDVLFALLRAISGLSEDELRRLLDDVQAWEFLYATQLFPEMQYTFTHSLTHDVTYNGVLLERRRDIHARIVDAIEKLYAGRLGEQIERLAHHAVRGELKDKAVHYFRQSGAKAAARSALSDARAWLEQALDISKGMPESPNTLEQDFDVRLELRPVLRQLGEGRQMIEQLREAEAIAQRLKDDRRRGLVCRFMTTVYSSVDELDEALAQAIARWKLPSASMI